jgi:hypothetical protein
MSQRPRSRCDLTTSLRWTQGGGNVSVNLRHKRDSPVVTCDRSGMTLVISHL